ncbi:MAG: WecB/TagA/CpsF family glycosyltransferase [Solirubrobacterales bacterium]
MFSKILNYNVFNQGKQELMEYIQGFEKVNIVSGNPEVLYNGLYEKELYDIFTSKSAVIIPDGIGTVLASKIVKSPVKEKIAGIEVMELIIKKCSEEGKGIYLLGAKEEVVSKCAKKLKEKYPTLYIAGFHNGYFDLDNCSNIIDEIKNKKPEAVFAAMGSPRQDRFILKYMDQLPVRIFMGVGGSFDVISGNINRAPRWMINLGLEWLYRVSKEPWRIKRLVSIPRFLIEVLLHKEE